MNVDKLWRQRIERELCFELVEEDFKKLQREYDLGKKITRKRARDISRKLIGIYPDQIISWFNYKTYLCMKYLPLTEKVKHYKSSQSIHPHQSSNSRWSTHIKSKPSQMNDSPPDISPQQDDLITSTPPSTPTTTTLSLFDLYSLYSRIYENFQAHLPTNSPTENLLLLANVANSSIHYNN